MGNCKTYEEFVDKFKPKKTTDDCYTPTVVYQAVADWVAKEYGVNQADFVRPFYPGGDYEHFDYSGKIVVDNPPFSILKKIVQFYVEKGIPFFLFAPTLVSITRLSDICTAIAVGVTITYENGANVNTSFLTNLEPHEIQMRSCPELYTAVNAANIENKNQNARHVQKISYPPEVVTSSKIYKYSQHGIPFVVPRSECVLISRLDAQADTKSAIFGGGLLVSEHVAAERAAAERAAAERVAAERAAAERAAAERAAAERAAATIYRLSDRERAIVKGLAE